MATKIYRGVMAIGISGEKAFLASDFSKWFREVMEQYRNQPIEIQIKPIAGKGEAEVFREGGGWLVRFRKGRPV